jgi:hypothetical protein
MTRRDARSSLLAVSLGAAVAALGCDNAGSTLGFTEPPTGTIAVGVYLDRDGTKTLTGFDTVFARANIQVFPPGGTVPVKTLLTDATGLAKFERLPLGQYRVGIELASIGDSLLVSAIDSVDALLTQGDTIQLVTARLAFPELTVREARAAPEGKRIFVRGILLSTLQTFRDTTVHLSDTSGFIRLTRAGLLGSTPGNNAGDSVTVIGHVSSRSGQPTIDQARIARLVLRPPPIPLPIATVTAATADDGRLDAALIQITAALIEDTVPVSPDFKVTIDDGTGPLDVILDATLNLPRAAFAPGRSMNIRGVLVPTGTGAWNLKPRVPGDIGFN